MSKEGLLKERRDNLFDTFNSGQIDERELERTLNADSNEAKKDILEQLNKISITNPILVDDLIKLRFRIKKWLGKK